jgi:hypothetical protein
LYRADETNVTTGVTIMCRNTVRVCVIVAAVVGAIHLSATQAKCIELLVYCARTIDQMDHITDVGMGRLDRTADQYAPLIEEATLAGDEVLVERIFHTALIQLIVHHRNTREQVMDVATRAAGERIAQPCLDDIFSAADLNLLLLSASAEFNLVRLEEATGGTCGICLIPPDDGPNGPPATKP